MVLEIITPEAIILSSEVTSVSVPGINGSFQMLDSHAAIVSLLGTGEVRFTGAGVTIGEEFEEKFTKDGKDYVFTINGGTLEMNNNKAILLAD